MASKTKRLRYKVCAYSILLLLLKITDLTCSISSIPKFCFKQVPLNELFLSFQKGCNGCHITCHFSHSIDQNPYSFHLTSNTSLLYINRYIKKLLITILSLKIHKTKNLFYSQNLLSLSRKILPSFSSSS